ncbi:MAG: hypothetical protein M1827_003558 [Pycnora praestabilis]|nr:MAG: hypothetical protein M1827_003558 [Pycnora praestabilis]
MPIPMASGPTPEMNDVVPAPFPAATKQAANMVNGVKTEVMSISFSDKIMVTITQGGRLAQWIHVPLDSSNPNYADQHLPDTDEDNLLPMPHLTPTTILGGTVPERETMGQLYATQIASAIATKNPEENRMVVVGLGLGKVDTDREAFFDILELVLQCI